GTLTVSFERGDHIVTLAVVADGVLTEQREVDYRSSYYSGPEYADRQGGLFVTPNAGGMTGMRYWQYLPAGATELQSPDGGAPGGYGSAAIGRDGALYVAREANSCFGQSDLSGTCTVDRTVAHISRFVGTEGSSVPVRGLVRGGAYDDLPMRIAQDGTIAAQSVGASPGVLVYAAQGGNPMIAIPDAELVDVQSPVGPPSATLPAPTGLMVGAVEATTVELTWSAPAAQADGVRGYGIGAIFGGPRPSVPTLSDMIGHVVVGPSQTSYTVGGLQPGTTYTFFVAALDDNVGRMTSVTVTTGPEHGDARFAPSVYYSDLRATGLLQRAELPDGPPATVTGSALARKVIRDGVVFGTVGVDVVRVDPAGQRRVATLNVGTISEIQVDAAHNVYARTNTRIDGVWTETIVKVAPSGRTTTILAQSPPGTTQPAEWAFAVQPDGAVHVVHRNVDGPQASRLFSVVENGQLTRTREVVTQPYLQVSQVRVDRNGDLYLPGVSSSGWVRLPSGATQTEPVEGVYGRSVLSDDGVFHLATGDGTNAQVSRLDNGQVTPITLAGVRSLGAAAVSADGTIAARDGSTAVKIFAPTGGEPTRVITTGRAVGSIAIG
ncbi:MAG: fibronectin type III domain-containing protein, partial [Propionibacteriaceae bacterium]|nr:fibronectin type III domain-containing protein [Propionibacteriaceae bacterium]